MKKLNKINNIALISILIAVFFFSNTSYSQDISCLRVPITSDTYSRVEVALASNSEIEARFKKVMGKEFEDITNFYIDDRTGRFVFQKKLKNSGDFITYYYENSTPVDIDGKVDALLQLYEETGGASENDVLTRYLVFKSLASKREKALAQRPKILDELKDLKGLEKHPKVKEEIGVAVNLISGKSIDGGRRLAVVFGAYEHRDLDIGKGGIKDVNAEFPRTFRNKRGHNSFDFIPYWDQIVDKFIYDYNQKPEVKQSGRIMKIESIPDSDFYVDGYKAEVSTLLAYNPATGEYESIDGAPIYLIKCDRFFSNIRNPKGEFDIYRNWLDDSMPTGSNLVHPENAATAMFFSKAILKASEKMELKPDIVVSADWQLGLIPCLLAKAKNPAEYAYFKKTKTIQMLHNIAYKGLFNPSAKIKIDREEVSLWNFSGLEEGAYLPANNNGLEFYSAASLLKGGLVYSDANGTVSNNYASEVQDEDFGSGFQGVLRLFPPFGIPNGIALRLWNSGTSSEFPFTQNPNTLDRELGIKDVLEGKNANRAALVDIVGDRRKAMRVSVAGNFKIDPDTRIPVFSFVGRFNDQKGLNIILDALETNQELRNLLRKGLIKIIFAGGGDNKDRYGMTYVDRVERLEKEFSQSVAYLGWVQEKEGILQLMAGTDVVLMPSGFEPAGLVQKQGARLAAAIAVNEVGGLAEDIIDFRGDSENGNGYIFNFSMVAKGIQDNTLTEEERISCIAMISKTMKDIIKDFNRKDKWEKQLRNVLKNSEKFGWDFSCLKFDVLCNILLENYDDVFSEHKIDHTRNQQQDMERIYDSAIAAYMQTIFRISNDSMQLAELQEKSIDMGNLFNYIRIVYEKDKLLTANFHSFGHSLEATKLAVELAEASGVELTINDIMEVMVAGILHNISPGRQSDAAPSVPKLIDTIMGSADILKAFDDIGVNQRHITALVLGTIKEINNEKYVEAMNGIEPEAREKIRELSSILADANILSTYIVPSIEKIEERVKGLAREKNIKEEQAISDTLAYLNFVCTPIFKRLPQAIQNKYGKKFEDTKIWFKNLSDTITQPSLFSTLATRTGI